MPKSYWEKRQELTFLAGEKKVKAYYKGLQKAFEQAKREIQGVISDFYVRYAIENKVTFAEAQKLLDKAEIGELKDFIAKVQEHMGEYNLELNNMSIKARITRYQALEKQVDALLQRLYAIEYQLKGEEALKEVYSDSYYRTWFNIDQYHGFHQGFAQVNPRTVEALINYPWNGANFSTRIWKQKDHMLQVLGEDITTMLVQGRPPKDMVSNLAKRFQTKEYEAYRLLHTESSFIIEQGTLAAYKEDGVKKYKIVATLDIKTSDICREKDGQIHNVKDAVVGVNYPPFHPFCRTTTVPYYEDKDEVGTRIARDPATGKTYEVPANMTYQEWYDKYVRNNPEAVLAEKKWKNRYSDQRQYEEYKKVLGDDLGVKSLDEFQELKYNYITGFEDLKSFYQYKKQYPDSNKLYYEINKEIQKLKDKGTVNKKIGTAVKPISIKILEVDKHAEIQMKSRGISVNDAEGYIVNAKVMFKQAKNTKNAYYSNEGASVIIIKGGILKTAFPRSHYDKSAEAIMEVADKYVK
ncbi:MAG: minor capsid protein [Clostridiaceae bacterium]|nr:minor capsid protein [Clostridiaceae bacterium]